MSEISDVMRSSATLVLLAVVAAAYGCTSSERRVASASDTVSVYACPMHPEVTSDKPGSCPKCKMKLVPK